MAREIKFRAWGHYYDEPDKMWYYNKWAVIEGRNTLVFEKERGNYVDDSDYYDDMILMQYTGLKDKNGKEIYEGDIVKKEEWQPPMEFCGYTVFIVEFNEFAFRYVPLKRFNTGWVVNGFDTELIKVIGNIYENPELLK